MDRYEIDTFGKINKDTTVSLMSDFHFNENVKGKRILKLLDKVEAEKPDYIFLLGDIINDTGKVDDIIDDVYYYLSTMSSIAPVYLINGNHDIMKKVDNGKWVYHINKEYIDMLNDIPFVNLLDNKNVKLPEGISLTGITLPIDYYQKYYENDFMYLIYLKEHIINGVFNSLENDNYNIFLCHSPNSIDNKNTYLKLLKMIKENINHDINFDLVLSGHLHNGLVPSYIDKFIPGNMGLIGINGPKVKLFMDKCRGIIDITDDAKIIILPAVTSLVAHPFLNNFFPATGKTLILKK